MATSPPNVHGRENVQVSNLPPPLPPRPAAPAEPGESARPATATPGGDWDWDRAKDLAERWFKPLADREGWLALGYLFLGAFIAPFLFVALAAASAVTFGLLFIFVGVFLIVPVFALAELFGKVERHIAAFAGHRIELRELRSLTGAGWRAPLLALSDPVRWRYVGFVAVNVVLAPTLFAFGSFPLSFVFQVVFGAGAISGPGFSIGAGISTGILALPLAAFFAGAIPRVAIWMSDLKAQISNWFIGTDRLALAEQRVTLLSSQRSDILDAVASERRRIERNLHDGVQQQLVAIGLDLGMAEQQIERDPERAKELIGNARSKVKIS